MFTRYPDNDVLNEAVETDRAGLARLAIAVDFCRQCPPDFPHPDAELADYLEDCLRDAIVAHARRARVEAYEIDGKDITLEEAMVAPLREVQKREGPEAPAAP